MFLVISGVLYEGEQVIRVFQELKDAVNFVKSSRKNFDCNYMQVVQWREGWKEGKLMYDCSC